MNALSPQSRSLVGTFRRFGFRGPVYEVTGFGPLTASGEQMMRIHVFDSGEDATYRLDDILEDPVAD